MKKILRQVTGTAKGFTFTKEEQLAHEIDEVGALYDVEVCKIKNEKKQ